jgi:ADP-heptose:LPS heptosyltransferase/GT2 family glycosyltransferase
VPVQPKTILYLRPDAIGDLILFTPALDLFLAAWPNARHVLVVRAGYEALAPIFPRSVEWKIANLNPYTQRPSDCRKELAALLADLSATAPDLVLAPTLNRTWLEIAVAAYFRDTHSVVLGDSDVDPIFATALRLDLGIDAAAAFKQIVPAQRNVRDLENQHRLAETLLDRKLPSEKPAVKVPGVFTDKARAIVAANKLRSGNFAAVFPGGLANVAVKSWPSRDFGQLVAWLQAEKKLPVLLLAHEDERAVVDQVSAEVEKSGGLRPATWLGKDGELPLLAALLQESRLYVGHDTGAMHMAAAVGRPVVGVFGGGHWPRFRPSARQAASVVQPLPCFGCNWDCHYGDGPCVKTIPASDVIRATERLLSEGDKAVDFVLESHGLPEAALKLIAAATPGITRLKHDRVARQHKIEELKAETDSKDIEMAALKGAAEERKREMEAIKAELEQECADKDVEIAELKAETNLKDIEMAALKGAAEERKREMETIKAELEQECADKDVEIAEIKAEANTKDAEIDALKLTCDEREQLIIRLDGGLREHIRAAGARETRIGEIEAERSALAETLRRLPEDADSWAQKFHDKDVHIGNIEALLRIRDEEILALRHANSNYAAGYGNVELAKHYGRLLSEKEAVVRELHRACVERQTVINQIASDATRPTSALRKLWIALTHHLREDFWRPIDRWLFRRVVENYWMQIGILRQYEPRPIAWDRRLSRADAAGAALPKVGIVTPSFAQPAYLESTMLSVLNQDYPKLIYVVQDGDSRDASVEIISKYASRLRHWASEPDAGQADAVRKGFSHIEADLGPDDVMAWFNSDDLLAPRALKFVASYFATHPKVDVVYGHRIIIDDADREIGRWIMPRHEADSVEWIDYVPQETLFWRKRAWDLVGGIDPSFEFALDWDLLARFRQAGCKVVRLPYFLGCFRVHSQQKTTQVIHTTGAREMSRIRSRFHGSEKDNAANIERHARRIRFRGALTARLLAAGIRW